ncbi:AbrB/MazE/SpoVT family DNA-binding domain-containing protein [Floridanema evergladense]|uniref:AbrB/MazE/SpoVT family DNA-binding domain-containing protein n=1 Tax=Floridaenema evergladense BLCC-F167 TaxID=3153639 RepID=A0ABV4WT96_9CYAN
MTTKINISKLGNSLTLQIPDEIAETLKLKVDDTVICTLENGKIVLEPVKKSLDYTLDELLAGEIETSEEVFWGKAEGEEVW